MAEILDYGHRNRSGIDKGKAKVLIALALLVLAVWGIPRVVGYVQELQKMREHERRVQRALAAQKACMEFSLPPGTIVYSDDPADTKAASAGYATINGEDPRTEDKPAFLFRDQKRELAIVRESGVWDAFDAASAEGWSWSFGRTRRLVFCHSLSSPGGNARLVTIELRDFDYLDPHVLAPGTPKAPPAEIAPSMAGLWIHRRLNHPLRIFAGQADPKDTSHFTIDIAYRGERRTIDAYLTPSDRIDFWMDGARLSGLPGSSTWLNLDAARPSTAPAPSTRAILVDEIPYDGPIAFSPDGKTLAVSKGNHMVGLWDVSTGRSAGSVPGDARAQDLAFSADGSSLAIGTDKGLCLWEINLGRMRWSQPMDSVRQLAFLPDGKRLLVSVAKQPVEVRDVGSGERLLQIGRPNIESFAANPTGDVLATSNKGPVPEGSPIRLWNIRTGEEAAAPAFDPVEATLGWGEWHDDFIGLNLAWSKDGKALLMTHGAIRAVDTVTGAELWTRKVGDQDPFRPVFSPDGRSFATAGFWGVCVFDFPQAKTERVLRCGLRPVSKRVAWSPDSRSLAGMYDKNTIVIWDLKGE